MAEPLTNNNPPPTTRPQSIGILLFPGFQALDAFGPLDALNILSHSQPLTLSILSRTLAPVSTRTGEGLSATFAQSVVPTHTLAGAPPLDVLLVPGGRGTRAADLEAELDFIRAVFPRLGYLLTVCTGSALVARAGVLDGRRATTNKSGFTAVAAAAPRVRWVKRARWVVDGNVWTSAGVSAGIDLTCAWIAHVWGDHVAKGVADTMEYERHEDPRWDPFARLHGLVGDGEDGDDEEAK